MRNNASCAIIPAFIGYSSNPIIFLLSIIETRTAGESEAISDTMWKKLKSGDGSTYESGGKTLSRGSVYLPPLMTSSATFVAEASSVALIKPFNVSAVFGALSSRYWTLSLIAICIRGWYLLKHHLERNATSPGPGNFYILILAEFLGRRFLLLFCIKDTHIVLLR